VNDFFKTLLLGNTEEPAAIFTEKLMQFFPEASSVEWFLDGRVHEAILIEHGQEKIVRFNDDGSMLDTRINLHLEELPITVRKQVELSGEIMSSILIREVDSVKYEFVVRDKSMKREIIFTDENGLVLRRRDFPEII
jgi:hypothetical protein